MSTKTPARPFPFLLSALLLGACGQCLLAQRENAWTLWPGFLILALAGFLFSSSSAQPGIKPESALSRGREITALIMIFLIALGMRVYRLDQFPAGIYYDESCLGWGALTILREGWRPFYQIFSLSNWDIPLYYLLALWFKFFSPTQVHFFLFSVFISLSTLPLAYWTFRQLSGPRAALLGLFILAVSRWDLTFSRNGHPAIEILFYIMGTLAFVLHGLGTGKAWAFGVGAAFFAGGFYAYQSYRAFALLVPVLFLYEYCANPERPRLRRASLLAFGAPALVLSSPMWFYWLQYGFLSWREKDVFIFPKILESGSLVPLFSHFMDGILMFNRQGDPWLLHNIPDHRMLDDGTAVLLILGFFQALFHWRERKYFYALAGLGVMCLPALLSNDATSASRAFGSLPFVALLSALALKSVWTRLRFFEKSMAFPLSIPLIFGILVLILGLNFQTYFFDQAVNYSCWRGADSDQTIVGKEVARYGNEYEYYLSPLFHQHYTVVFLGFAEKDHMRRLDLPEGLALMGQPAGRGALFALEEGQKGLLQLLQSIYPGGETESVRDIQGHTIVYFYRVPAQRVDGGRKNAGKFLLSDFGLRGTYRASPDPAGRPVTLHRDILLNFTSKDDFPLGGNNPFWVLWEGSWVAPVTGTYFFLGLASDPSALSIDGKSTPLNGNDPSPGFQLAKGRHHIAIDFKNNSRFSPAFSFLWKKPGEGKFEVVPASAFRTH